MPTQRLIVVGPNLPNEARATFHVHAEGCADLRRGWLGRIHARELQHAPAYVVEYPSLVAVVEDVYQDQLAEQDEPIDPAAWLSEFHFAPCVHLPETSEEVAR